EVRFRDKRGGANKYIVSLLGRQPADAHNERPFAFVVCRSTLVERRQLDPVGNYLRPGCRQTILGEAVSHGMRDADDAAGRADDKSQRLRGKPTGILRSEIMRREDIRLPASSRGQGRDPGAAEAMPVDEIVSGCATRDRCDL